MNYWNKPHISKVYEALTAIADGRLKMISETSAKCFSSTHNKFYSIEYDPQTAAFMSNDNTAWYTGSLSYPMIAFLMLNEKISYNHEIAEKLKGIEWKVINQRYKNDYDSAISYVLNDLRKKGIEIDLIKTEAGRIFKILSDMKIGILGVKKFPSKAY